MGTQTSFFKMFKRDNTPPIPPPPVPITLTANDTRLMYKQDADYATARLASVATWLGSTIYQGVGAYITGGFFQVRRTYVRFDFTTLTADVTAATLYIHARFYSNPSNLSTISCELCTNAGTLNTGNFSDTATYYGRTSVYTADGNYWKFAIPLTQVGLDKINQNLSTRFVIKDYNHDYLNGEPTTNTSGSAYDIAHATIDLTF